MKKLLVLLMALVVTQATAQLKKSYVKYADSTRIADSSRAGGVNDSAANIAGTGVGIYKTETSDEMLFKRLKGGTNITISDSTDSVMIVGADSVTSSARADSLIGFWADSASWLATDYETGLRLLKSDTASLSARINLKLTSSQLADSLDSAQTIQNAWTFTNGLIWGDATTQNSKGIPWGSPANRETPVYDTAAAVYILETTPVNVTTATYYPRMSTDGDTVKDGSLFDSSGTTIATGPWSFQGNVGIGTMSPGYELDVTGSLRVTSSIYLNNAVTGVAKRIYSDAENDLLVDALHLKAGYSVGVYGVRGTVNGMSQSAAGGNKLGLFANSQEVITLNSGKVGIMSSTPDSTLTVSGSMHATSNVKVDGNLTVVGGLRAIYSWTIDSTALALYGTSFNRTWFKTDADSVKVDSLCAVSYGRASGDTVSVRVLWGASRDTPSDSLSDLKCYHAAGGVAAVSTKVIPPNQFVWVKITEEDGAAKEIQFEIKGKRKP